MIDAPLPSRLLKGASVLGKLWRENIRCPGGWSSKCDCPSESRSKFCVGKLQFVKLATEVGRMITDGPLGLVEAMTPEEREATGLTVTLEYPELGKVKVGPKGDIPWKVYKDIEETTLRTVLSVLKTFPGSKVVG